MSQVFPAEEGDGGRYRRRRKIFIVSMLLVVAILIGTIWAWNALQASVNSLPLSANPNATSTVKPLTGDLTFAVIGTDTRTGQGAGYGSEDDGSGAGRADVILVVHLDAVRNSIAAVSIPRDLMTKTPECVSPQGVLTPAQDRVQINSTLATSGPGCTVDTLNDLLSLKIDHFLVADFKAVIELTKQLGGVEVCSPTAVNDGASGLNIPAGKSKLEGEEALAYLRTRHSFGDGSDLARIKAQQAFMSSLAIKLKDTQFLADPAKTLGLAKTALKYLTVDHGLKDIGTLLQLAERLKNSNLATTTFRTLPILPDPADPNRVIPDLEGLKILTPLLQGSNAPTPSAETTAPLTTSVGKNPSSTSSLKQAC